MNCSNSFIQFYLIYLMFFISINSPIIYYRQCFILIHLFQLDRSSFNSNMIYQIQVKTITKYHKIQLQSMSQENSTDQLSIHELSLFQLNSKQLLLPKFEPQVDVELFQQCEHETFDQINGQQIRKQRYKFVEMKMKYFTVQKFKQYLSSEDSHYIAKGELIGNFDREIKIKEEVQFQGNFKGVFENHREKEETIYYFQGKIQKLKIHKGMVKQKQQEDVKYINELVQNILQQRRPTYTFKGLFRGTFIKKTQLFYSINMKTNKYKNESSKLLIKKRKVGKKVHYIPAFTKFFVQQISEINLAQSSAQIYGTIWIEVQLSDQIADIINKKWNPNMKKQTDQQKLAYQKQLQKWKYVLSLEFNRDRIIPLPFYDTDNELFPKTDDQSQYEWDDLWSGISMQSQWIKQQKKMKYRIQTLWNSDIDNSHGIFYTPFNLIILKIVINFQSIKIDDQNIIKIVCCDLQDFGIHPSSRQYSPYTYFNNLQLNKNSKLPQIIYERHIDRLTKINKASFNNQGQFSIADNRMYLFPYHKSTFINKNTLSDHYSWSLGTTSRTSLLEQPQIHTVKFLFNKAKKQLGTKYKAQKLEFKWQYIHIQVPLFKYPVIDLIRIFIPILVLNIISLLIFQQENGSSGGITKISSRIASACSLLIAYTAMVPTIRENLPPTPSITLIQILIYASTLPNFLAIMSAFVNWSKTFQQFFADYNAFSDPLFMFSFILGCISSVLLIILICVYSHKDYRVNFSISKFKESTMDRIRQPTFMRYFTELEKRRKQYKITYKDINDEQKEKVQRCFEQQIQNNEK